MHFILKISSNICQIIHVQSFINAIEVYLGQDSVMYGSAIGVWILKVV